MARAIEARLSDDHEAMMDIALHPNCPPKLLGRLASAGVPGVRAAVLLHPRCPADVLEETVRHGRVRMQLLAALHPEASPELLDRLARGRKKTIVAALLIHPRTSRQTLARLAAQQPELQSVVELFSQGEPQLDDLRHVLPPLRDSSTLDVLRAGDAPFDLLLELAAAGGGYGLAATLRANAEARARVGELLDAVGIPEEDPPFRDLLSTPQLPLRWLSACAHRLASRKASGGSAREDRWDRRRRFARLRSLDLACAHPGWRDASTDELEKLARVHPHCYGGLLDNPHVPPARAQELRARAHADVAFIAAWPEPPLVAALASPSPRTRSSIPIPRACGLAARPDTPADVARRMSRRSTTALAAWLRGPHADVADLEEHARNRSPSVRSAVYSNPRTPAELLPELIASLPECPVGEAAGNLGLDEAGLRALIRPNWVWDDGFAFAGHPSLPMDMADWIARGFEETAIAVLLHRADIPLTRREGWADAKDPSYRLLLAETSVEERDRAIDALCAARGSGHWHQESWLLVLCPALTATQLERLARLLAEAAPSSLRGDFRWGRFARHPQASETTAEILFARSSPSALSDSVVLSAIAQIPAASTDLLERVLRAPCASWRCAVVRHVAGHPNAPRPFLRNALFDLDDEIQEAAAGNCALPVEEVMAARLEPTSTGSQAWLALQARLALGPAPEEALAVLARHGRPALPVAPERLAIAEIPGEVAVELLAQPWWDADTYARLARHVANSAESPLADEARKVLACHCQDPVLLEWVSLWSNGRDELLGNPSTPPELLNRIVAATESHDLADTLDQLPAEERERVLAHISAEPLQNVRLRRSEREEPAREIRKLLFRYPEGRHGIADSWVGSKASEAHAGLMLALHFTRRRGMRTTDTASFYASVARAFGMRFLVWAASSGRHRFSASGLLYGAALIKKEGEERA